METGFLSFFVVKLKQIHIDKGITAGYSTNIPQCLVKDDSENQEIDRLVISKVA